MTKTYWIVKFSWKDSPNKLHDTAQIFNLNEAIKHCKKLNKDSTITNAGLICCKYTERNELVILED